MLDAWVGVVPAEKVLPVVVDFLASPKASNEGKVTGLRWVASVVQASACPCAQYYMLNPSGRQICNRFTLEAAFGGG